MPFPSAFLVVVSRILFTCDSDLMRAISAIHCGLLGINAGLYSVTDPNVAFLTTLY